MLSFENLPFAVSELTKEVSQLKALLLENNANKAIPQQQERLLSIQEAATFLNLSTPTIYSKVSKRELPVIKRGKRLYFSDNELLAYLKEGRKKTNAEIEAEAEAYLLKNKKGLNYGK